MKTRYSAARGAAVSIVVALAACLSAPPARSAEDALNYYQATTIVTGYDMRSRPLGFARCLQTVLVNLSGEPRLANDPRVAALAAHAETLVASFNYVDQMAGIKVHDDQGTYDRSYNLTVKFVPERIDGVLADLGERPWRGTRPTIVPMIRIRRFSSLYLLSADEPAGSEQRPAFATAAADYYLNVRFPSRAEFASASIALDGVLSAPPASPGEEAFVIGTLEFQESLPGWVGSWQLRWHGAGYRWGIKGVNYDDAFRDLARGVLRIASGHGAPD
ncbi:MAG TPA: DUF2066 domain-containing protein [Stellaceae bacterium]|nr:DUF2066 domain-containing protein [Stellaceae bacterium]HUK08386.1 DUF2066 domain-containing protein [Stellaceae bacterium]